MFGPQYLFANVTGSAQLFQQLAFETLFVRFARLALAAGKFPVAGKMRALQPARDQECAVAFDDSGKNDYRVSGHVALGAEAQTGTIGTATSVDTAGIAGCAPRRPWRPDPSGPG
jgi:hypothetical protein